MRVGGMQYWRRLILLLALAAGLAGCATEGMHSWGLAELKAGNSMQAIRLLKEELELNPTNWKARRDLGIAYYKSDAPADAREQLENVYASHQDDAATILCLGAIAEETGELPEALTYYGRYIGFSRLSPTRMALAGCAKRVTRELARRELRARMAREEDLTSGELGALTIALIHLNITSEREDFHALEAALIDEMIRDLTKIKDLAIVERIHLDVLLEELKLSEQGLIDPATAPRAGRLMGAHRIVGGHLLDLQEDRMKISLSVADVRTAEAMSDIDEEGACQDFYAIEKELVYALLGKIHRFPDDEEWAVIDQIPTRNLNAVLAYGRGLLAERAGRVKEARKLYEAALALDAGFGLASDALGLLGDPNTRIWDAVAPEIMEFEIDLGTRLVETDDLTGGDLWPEEDEEVRELDVVSETIPEPPGPPDLPSELPDAPDPPSGSQPGGTGR